MTLAGRTADGYETPLEPYYKVIVAELAESLRKRAEFRTAWALAVQKHKPGYSWTTDHDNEEDSVAPLSFLRAMCKTHYEYRLAELKGEAEGLVEPPFYPIFTREDDMDEQPWKIARVAPTPRGGHN